MSEAHTTDAFAAGVDHFNALRFWEAHEAWESIWLEAAAEDRSFYQGLIQLAAAYHHMKRGTFRGAVRLFGSAMERLSAFPARFRGLDRAEAVAAAERHRDLARSGVSIDPDDYPKLALPRR